MLLRKLVDKYKPIQFRCRICLDSEFPARDDEYSAGNKYWCLAWAVGQSKIQSFSVVAILGVIVVNMILTSVMRKLVVFESHHFKTDVIASLMTKLFLMKF